MRIRDERLYRKDYPTFEDYCRGRWQFQRNYANKLIASAGVVKNLGTTVPAPESERHLRPLTELPPEKQSEAWGCLHSPETFDPVDRAAPFVRSATLNKFSNCSCLNKEGG